MKKSMIHVGLFGLFVLIGVITALFVIDSPATVRLQEEDRDKAAYMRQVSSEVNNYYLMQEELPASLDDVEAKSTYMYSGDSDLVAFDDIEYEIIDSEKGTYKLCSTFSTNAEDREYYYYDAAWNYDAGYYCFELRALVK